MATASPPPAQPRQPPQETPGPDLKILWMRCALFTAVIGVIGSLHLSLNMDPPLKACPLCYYQRSFIMAVTAILAVGMFMPAVPTGALTALALAPAFAGAYVAGQHTWMVVSGEMECPTGITGKLTAPTESVIVYILLMAFLLGDLYHRRTYVMHGAGALLLGYLFATTSWHATPTMPPRTTPYGKNEILDMCRKPFQEKK